MNDEWRESVVGGRVRGMLKPRIFLASMDLILGLLHSSFIILHFFPPQLLKMACRRGAC
jgi:hypothetical protein